MALHVFCWQILLDGAQAVTGITSGRAQALIGGFMALVSLVLAWRARVRARSGGNARLQAMVGLVLGVVAIVLSLVHLSTSAGAVFGSGSGKAGAIVALVLGVAGSVWSGLVLRRRTSVAR